ncbi:AMP-binding protein [Streptomyces sp. NBC_01390]|uniref:AMP-binding protein n=1 Tax=Streptomyces sp. NBC_01390 TaxID=2903850 RepID=UPI00324AAD90
MTMAHGHRTLGSVLKEFAHLQPNAPFLAYERGPGLVETTTWGQMAARALSSAELLSSHGVRAGDKVGVHLTNCPEFYDVWFGAALLGAAVVPTNPLLTADELRYVVDHAGCEVVVTQADLADTTRAAGARTIIDVEHAWHVSDTFADWDSVDLRRTDGGTLAAIMYTSGTTSRPKGVMVTHAAYLNAGDVVAGHLRLRRYDRNLIVLPLFHGNAQYYSTMSAFVSGASVALTPRFSASRWSEQALATGATVASLFAAPIRMLLAQSVSDADHMHQMRVVIFAQNVSAAQVTEFQKRFGVDLLQLYGMTETVFPPLMNPLLGTRNSQAMGRPVAGARIRLVDDQGNDVPLGTPGQLLVGANPGCDVMTGYLANPEATASTLVDGWLHTGDVAAMDSDGFVIFVDRAKDMIKRAGENVACSEVEAVIGQHPAVFESAAVGVPDEMRDEALVAFVVLCQGAEATPDEILDFCRERLAKFKVPDSVKLVRELPRTPVGKIQKHRLKGSLPA